MNEVPTFAWIVALAVGAILFVAIARAALRTGRTLFVRATVSDWQWGLLYRDGRFRRVAETGAVWLLPRDRLVLLPRTETTAQTGAQEVLTADRLQVKIVALLVYRVADPRLAFETVASGHQQDQRVVYDYSVQTPLLREAILALRDQVEARPLAGLLADRAAADAAFAAAMAPVAARYGLALDRAVIRDVILPADLRRLYAEKERVRIEGEAALDRARSEQATLRALANAARLLRDNPDLATLRLLQALNPAPGSPAPTIVLGAPGLVPQPGQGPRDGRGPRPDAGSADA